MVEVGEEEGGSTTLWVQGEVVDMVGRCEGADGDNGGGEAYVVGVDGVEASGGGEQAVEGCGGEAEAAQEAAAKGAQGDRKYYDVQ